METTMSDGGQHEFNENENEIIRDLANAMRWVRVPFMLLGILYGLSAAANFFIAFKNPTAIIPAICIGLACILFITLGNWTEKAAASFLKVTETEGKDVSHLMDALSNLRSKYRLLAFIVKIYVGLLLVAFIALVAMLLRASFS
jgi:hypothetical protein